MHLGVYRVERALGRGGMGEVVLAWDERLHRHVAIKRIRADKADERHRARFRREARAAARLRHPAVVRIYDVLEIDGDDCIVMEHVEGRGLDEMLADGPLGVQEALGLARDIAAGLGAAHEKGLIHRDLKASNIRVETSGPKILDFGLVRHLDDDASGSLTAPGQFVGTPHAMSPEQVVGRPVDHRSDLFALGALLYEMLSGERPFLGDGVADTLRRVVTEEPVPILEKRPEVPESVADLLDRLLAKDPAARLASAGQVIDELADSEARSVRTDLEDQTTLVSGESEAPVLRVLVQVELLGGARSASASGELRDRFGGRELSQDLLSFERPADAVAYALAFLETGLRARVGVHLGEVVLSRGVPSEDLISRIVQLSQDGQISLTQAVFDLARRSALAGPMADPELRWLAHGAYLFPGVEEPVEIFEVGREGLAPLTAPPDSDAARRVLAVGNEQTLGWRPAAGQEVPRREHWELVERLGEGGFGEVWLASHKSGESRVFKFCFEPGRIKTLKREVTLLRLMRDGLGYRDDIARVLDWSFDEAPFFVELEHTECGSLKQWAAEQGGIGAVPMTTRLELAAEVAAALAAAHSVGVLHKDVKPENVLVRVDRDAQPHAVLTDFGVGLLTDREHLRDVGFTVLGFTETVTPTTETSGGTLGFLAPELIEGKPSSIRTDIYALGVVVYQLVVGDFSRTLAPGWQRDIEDEVLVEDVASLVDGNPERRPRSASEVVERLRSIDERRTLRRETERARVALERSQHLRKRALLFAMTAAVVALVVTVVAIEATRMRRAVEEERNRAQNLALAAHAGSFLYSGMNTWGNLLALEVRRLGEPPGAVETLHRALEGGVKLTSLDGHTNSVFAATFSPDGSRVVTASGDKTARIWDVATRGLLVSLDGHLDYVRTATFSPDGSRVATASDDKTARVWNVPTGEQLASLDGHTDIVRTATFSPDGSRVVTASHDKTARIWNVDTGEQLASFQGCHGGRFTERVFGASFSPDRSRVVTACEDGTARIWDVSSGEQLASLEGQPGWPVMAASFSRDGSRVVTASTDRTARIWDASTGEQLASLEGHTDYVFTASFSRDGSRVVTASGDKTARIWNVGTGEQLASLRGHPEGLTVASFNPDSSLVVTGSTDSSSWIWNVETGEQLVSLEGHKQGLSEVSFSPDGSRVVTASGDKTARIWNVETGEQLASLDHTDHVSRASISPDGARVVTASWDKAWIWDVSTGEKIASLEGHTDRVSTALFSPDGSQVVTASFDNTARTWDAVTGEQIASLEGHTRWVAAASFSPDGSRVVTASFDNTVRIWNVATGEQLASLEGHMHVVDAASFSPDGSRVVTASRDNTARIWDVATGEQLASLDGHLGFVQTATFSPDGSRVVTASEDTARIWNFETGEQLALLEGHKDSVYSVSFSPDGSRIVTASKDRTARIWDASTGKQLAYLSGHTDGITAVYFSPDGLRVATASRDGTARIWANPADYIPFLQSRIRARTRLCIPANVRQKLLAEPPETAGRKESACETCVPKFFDRLGDTTLWEYEEYIEAWKVYEACFWEAAGE